MDKKSKILMAVFVIIVVVSVTVTFYKYMILKDINFYVNADTFHKSLSE